MFSSIKQKLTAMYIVLIIVPLLVINYLSVENMRRSVLGEIEVNTLKTANIISNISRDNFDRPLQLRRSLYQYTSMLGGRILILDSNRRVMVDSFHLLDGNTINNKEIRQAFQGQEKYGYYRTDKDILQAAVPIMQVVDTDKNVLGLVLVSVSVSDAFKSIDDFRQQLVVISIAVAIIGIIAALFASQRIGEPIVSLAITAKRIGEGHLGETINIKSNDEIGKLATNFNYMSRELYRIDRGRSQFIGDVSHELKTPLASMKALIDSLLYGEDDIKVYQEYLRDIDGEIDRLSDLVSSLLSLNQIGEEGIQKSVFSLKHLVQEAIRILNPLAEKYSVVVSLDLQNSPLVHCDGNRIKEVFINLIHNALKYRDTEKNINKIIVRGFYKKDSYKIIVEDNGIGIGEDEISAVFEKFYRTDSSRSRDTGGAGLGLSIVSRILQLHKWEVEVSSRLGIGSSIIICIPKDSLKDSL